MAYIPPNPNGQATSANSAPVVLASDQSTLNTNQATLHAGEDLANDVQKVSSKSGILKYQAAAGTNIVVSVGPSYLEGIIFGADNGSAQVQISDHESDASANIVIQLNGDTLLSSAGYIPVNAHFDNGITCNLVNQTQVTFIGW